MYKRFVISRHDHVNRNRFNKNMKKKSLCKRVKVKWWKYLDGVFDLRSDKWDCKERGSCRYFQKIKILVGCLDWAKPKENGEG